MLGYKLLTLKKLFYINYEECKLVTLRSICDATLSFILTMRNVNHV